MLKPLRSWAPVLVLSVVVVVAAAIVANGLRASPISPSRPVLVSSGSWAPFVGPDLPDGGPVTALVTETLRRSGYSPEITYTSWSLAEERVASGATIGMFPMVGSAARREKFLVSDPIIDFEYVLFYDRRKGEPRAEDLGSLRVGGISGYDYWDELDAAVTDYVVFDSALDGFRALADGRVDVLAEGMLSGQAVLADPAFAGDAADFGHLAGDSPLVHSVEGLYFMMADTPEAARVMREFNRTLARIRQSQEYADIVAGLSPSASQEVTLIPYGRTGLVELLDEKGGQVLLAPRGTRARVLAWPEAFTGAGATKERVLVRVKVTNGPARGRALYVDARAIQVEGS